MSQAGDDAPYLLFVYGRGSPSPLDLAERLGGVCRPIWLLVMDADEALLRLLAHFGPVLNYRPEATRELLAALVERRPAGIVALDDFGLAAAGELSRQLGFSFHSSQTIERLTDKLAQREALRQGGLSVPGVVTVAPSTTPDKVLALAKHLAFPVVLKPRTGGGGSREVERAQSEAELVASWARHLEREQVEDYLIEEELIGASGIPPQLGDYVSVETLVTAGEAHHYGITGKFALAAPFRESGAYLPPALAPTLAEAVKATAAAALDAVGFHDGVAHTEIKLTPSGPVVIEVNGRAGGGPTDDLYAAWFGIPIIRLAALAAIGRPTPAPTPLRATLPFEYWVQPPQHATRIEAIGGIERVLEIEGVSDVRVNRGVGEHVDWRRGSMEYVLAVIGRANDLGHLTDVPRRVAAALHISYGARD